MKKLLFFLLALNIASSYAQNGDSMMVNIWGDKLFCKTEMEDAVDDRKGNEAFVQYHWAIVNADNGTIVKSGIQANLDIKMLFRRQGYLFSFPVPIKTVMETVTELPKY